MSTLDKIWIVLKVIGCMAFMLGVIFALVYAAIGRPEHDEDEDGYMI